MSLEGLRAPLITGVVLLVGLALWTRAEVHALQERHREEMRRHGVHVTASCPGFVETEFQQAAGGTVESVSFPRWLWIPAERVARAGIDAVERNKPISIPGRIDRLIAIAFKLMPGPLARWVVRGES